MNLHVCGSQHDPWERFSALVGGGALVIQMSNEKRAPFGGLRDLLGIKNCPVIWGL